MNVVKKIAYYHLPGLFEFYELYRIFLPLYQEHREYFYDWCEISSIYGAPEGCLWGGGRIGCGDENPQEVLKLINDSNKLKILTLDEYNNLNPKDEETAYVIK